MVKNLERQFQIPWYKEGFPFSCTQCGKCCTGSPGYVWASENEIKQMAEFLCLTVSDFKRLYMRRIGQRWTLVEKKSQNHSCVFYHNQKCKIYGARPLQCRSYPFWQNNLLTEESWKRTAQECEGIHSEAPLIPFKSIEKIIEEQRKQEPEDHFISSLDPLSS